MAEKKPRKLTNKDYLIDFVVTNENGTEELSIQQFKKLSTFWFSENYTPDFASLFAGSPAYLKYSEVHWKILETKFHQFTKYIVEKYSEEDISKILDFKKTSYERLVNNKFDGITEYLFNERNFVSTVTREYSEMPTHEYSSHSVLQNIRIFFTKEVAVSPLYKTYTDSFNAWLEKKPEIVRLFKLCYPDKPLDLDTFAVNCQTRKFRSALENARPRKIEIGSLVELKESYYDTRRKDPFRWNHELRAQNRKRIGMVMKYVNNPCAKGIGSRMLKIYWTETEEQTDIMERCVKPLKAD